MTTVKIKQAEVIESPSQPSPDFDIVTDAKGRPLKIKAPDVLSESRIVRMMGDASMNTAYMYGYVMPAVQVVEIDGQAVMFPASALQVEALITRLGREGLSAVLAHFEQKAKAAADDASEDELKN